MGLPGPWVGEWWQLQRRFIPLAVAVVFLYRETLDWDIGCLAHDDRVEVMRPAIRRLRVERDEDAHSGIGVADRRL